MLHAAASVATAAHAAAAARRKEEEERAEDDDAEAAHWTAEQDDAIRSDVYLRTVPARGWAEWVGERGVLCALVLGWARPAIRPAARLLAASQLALAMRAATASMSGGGETGRGSGSAVCCVGEEELQ